MRDDCDLARRLDRAVRCGDWLAIYTDRSRHSSHAANRSGFHSYALIVVGVGDKRSRVRIIAGPLDRCALGQICCGCGQRSFIYKVTTGLHIKCGLIRLDLNGGFGARAALLDQLQRGRAVFHSPLRVVAAISVERRDCGLCIGILLIADVVCI